MGSATVFVLEFSSAFPEFVEVVPGTGTPVVQLRQLAERHIFPTDRPR